MTLGAETRSHMAEGVETMRRPASVSCASANQVVEGELTYSLLYLESFHADSPADFFFKWKENNVPLIYSFILKRDSNLKHNKIVWKNILP